MGKRLAHSLISSNILDYLELSDDYSMVEVRSGKAMLGKTLIDLDIRAKFGCNVVAISHGKEMNVSPIAYYQITEVDVLIVIEADNDILKFLRHQFIYLYNKYKFIKICYIPHTSDFYSIQLICKKMSRYYVFSIRISSILSIISFLNSVYLLVLRSIILFNYFGIL